MRRLGLAPKHQTFNQVATNEWLHTVGQRLEVATGSANPVASEIPEGQWVVYNNTGAGEVRIWTKISGVLLKSAAFT